MKLWKQDLLLSVIAYNFGAFVNIVSEDDCGLAEMTLNAQTGLNEV